MNNKNLLSGRDKELQQLAEQYEAAREAKKPLYMVWTAISCWLRSTNKLQKRIK